MAKPKRRVTRPKMAPKHLPITWEEVFRRARVFSLAIVGLSAFVAAWLYLNFPVPATTAYVRSVFDQLTGKVDQVNILGLQNRLVQLQSSLQSLQAQKSDLDIKLKQIKDPTIVSLINNQEQTVTQQLGNITDQIAQVKSELSPATIKVVK